KMLARNLAWHSLAVALLATHHGVAADLDTLDLGSLEFDKAIPTVLTPVRLKQPRTEVPASVTVIDRQLIEASGLHQLAEIFRLVPGTSVGARDGWNYVVSYHG